MVRVRQKLGLLAVVVGVALPAAAADPWGIPDAPYRAVVRLKTPAAKPTEAGAAIEMPEFGHTLAGLVDLVLTDAAGRMQPLAPVWRYDGQKVIVLARDLKPGTTYYLYFGGNKLRRGMGGWTPKISLFMETRRLPAGARFDSWGDMENIWRKATAVDGGGLVPAIYHGQNPFGESLNFCTHYSGWLQTGAARELYLYTQSSDASFVLVNGRLAFEWPGKHPARANARTVIGKKVDCGEGGLTKIDYYHVKSNEGAPAMSLGWQRAGRLQPVPLEAYLHPAATEVERYEDAQGRPIPLPRFTLQTYMGCNELWFFEARLWAPEDNLEGWTVQWTFEDGAVLTGPQIERVLLGLAPMKVWVRMQRGSESVSGVQRMDFAQVPRQASVNNTTDVARYLALFARETPAQLSLKSLRAGVLFLREYGDEQEAGRFAEAYLKKNPDPADPVWIQAQLARLRVLSQVDPKQALAELRRMDSAVRKRYSRQVDLFEMDLLVFCLRDDSAVQRALQIGLENQGSDVARIARIRVGDLYRLQGKYKEAIEQYQSLQKAVVEESAGRKLPAQDRAFSVAVAEMLANGYRHEVEEKLREWESEHPMAKLESDFLLMRARFLITLGRWREALTELESFEKMQPDSPYQIDINFYKARTLFELGHKEQARQMWAQIARKYPKHALAEQSRTLAARK